jgi:Protein of unknown function (DUF3558)
VSRSFLTLALAFALLSGCGGDDDKAAPGTPANPLAAVPPDGSERAGASEPAPAVGKPGYEELVERQSSKPLERFTPCNLVTARAARAIVGAPLAAPFEAPLGPTCIYRTKDGKRLIGLAVQRTPFRAIRPAIRERRPLVIGGRDAVCGVHGQPTLYVPLGRARVLSVTAPCGVASEFAHEALRHL